jgi:cbb3-type cytochrome oxidase maturation protein
MISKSTSKPAVPWQRTATGTSPSTRAFLWCFSIVMVLTAGTAFVFKLIEFFLTAVKDGPGSLGSFLIPVLTYLIVAAGFACMFLWAYLSGQFKDIEHAKYRMLELQAQIDRAQRR